MPKQYKVKIDVQSQAEVGFRAKAHPPAGKRRWFYQLQNDIKPQHSHEGLLARVVRVLDKRRDRYEERVTMIDSGEVVHESAGTLSEHQGHGSAKLRGK
nr:hypothetical protein [uncultured Devosia sp.]